MAKKSSTAFVTPEVRKYLSANGRKGGLATRKLIKMGKKSTAQRGDHKPVRAERQ